jgi:hypothetical protein
MDAGRVVLNPLIGAHAAIAGYRLLTRDVRRYRTYFPTVDIIAPATSEGETAGRA